MKLAELLLHDINADDVTEGQRHMCIRGLSADSRNIRDGFLFAAMPGRKSDGRDFIEDAVQAGAVCVLAPVGTTASVPVIGVENPRHVFAVMAGRFYARQPDNIAAITGTNGKTSVASFTRQIWASMGHPAASLGTMGVMAPSIRIRGGLTTPDPVELHRLLTEMKDSGVTHLAMEASSHGLDQCRLDGVQIRVAGFTNITHDHLDYHGDMETYLAAKLRLFTELVASDGYAVINTDGAGADAVREACVRRGLSVVLVGYGGDRIQLLDVRVDGDGQLLSLEIDGVPVQVRLPLLGAFQVENALVALGIALALGARASDALAALEKLRGVSGRMETTAKLANGALIVVDYAHTADALTEVLQSLRPHARNHLNVVFGCGGDRDARKRPIMGGVAQRLADHVTITDDNPRSERPETIRAEILAACPGAKEIDDRAEAIRSAMNALGAGDVLVIAGKGHETGQIIGDITLPFDDRALVRTLAREIDSQQESGVAS